MHHQNLFVSAKRQQVHITDISIMKGHEFQRHSLTERLSSFQRLLTEMRLGLGGGRGEGTQAGI